jgi:uncharacterized protein YbbK (DUF523 family)
MKKVAISACLLGKKCRYDGTDNRDETLLKNLEGMELIPFCPEDDAFGTPRPTMDLVQKNDRIEAVSNATGKILSKPIREYAEAFFDNHRGIELFIGKDRSPSCGVCSARLYNEEKTLISDSEAGLMAKEAIKRGIIAVDAEKYEGEV